MVNKSELTNRVRIGAVFTIMISLLLSPVALPLSSLAADEEVLTMNSDEELLIAKKDKDDHKKCKEGDKDCMITCGEKGPNGEFMCPKVAAACGFTCGAMENRAGCNSNPALHCKTVVSGAACDCRCLQ
jgi:hypothetical protein